MIAWTEMPLFSRPRLVVAEGNSAQAALLCRQFRRLGWEVHLASSGPDARRLARLLEPHVVILDTALREESGWLTCAKLTLENEELEVILLGESATESQRGIRAIRGCFGPGDARRGRTGPGRRSSPSRRRRNRIEFIHRRGQLGGRREKTEREEKE